MADDVTVVTGGNVTIAPSMQMTVETFEPCYLAFVDEGGRHLHEEVYSFEQYRALWAAGWRDSLGAFGVETAPASTVYVSNAPPAPEAYVSPDTYQQVLGLLTSHQAQMDDLEARVDALEAAQAAPAAPEAPTHERGRRS